MSDTLLRSGLIRLAYANPHLRADLLPLIEKEAAGPSYKDYVDKKRKKGEKPLDEAAWESRVKGKGKGEGEGGKSEDKSERTEAQKKDYVKGLKSDAEDIVVGIDEVMEDLHEGGVDYYKHPKFKGITNKLLDVMGELEDANPEKLGEAEMEALHKKVSDGYRELQKAVQEHVSEGSKGKAKSKSEKPKASFKKNYRPKMESVMTKHELTDDDAKQVIEFSVDRPKKGKPQSPEELKRRFMQNAKPETKERMKNMTPADFMVMLRAVLDQEEGGGGKTASLRNGLIRLAYANPSLRPTLLPLIEKHAKSFDDAVKGKKFKHPETGNDVLFGSLPSEEQTKIRSQWVKKNPRGSGGDGSDPKAMLKEDSDKYFAQHVSGNIGKKSLTDALKGTGFAPRGKGSFDKKRGLVELYLDSEDRSSPPMRAVFSGSDYTKGDGKGYIRIDHPRHGQIDDSFKMTGDPEADAKQMHSALKELAEQMGDYEKEYKSSKKASVGNNMHAELDADADPTSHDQNLPEHYYFNKGAAKGESVEAEVKQFASPKSKDQNKPEHYYGLPPKGKQAARKPQGVVERNQLKVLLDTVRNPAKGMFLGGPSAEEAEEILREKYKYTDAEIAKLSKTAAARPLAPGVHLVEDLSVLGPNFRLVYRELGSDYLGSEQVPGYYLDLGGLLKLVVKTPKQSPAGEAQAKKAIANLLRMMKAGSGKQASVKTAGGSGAANAAFLRQSPLKNKVLQAVAKYYGVSVSVIEGELTDPDAEALYEYIGNDRALQMQVYREFKSKGF